MAAKLKRRLPFTTFATRWMATTRSFRSIPLALTVLMLLTDISIIQYSILQLFFNASILQLFNSFLEYESALARAFGKRLDVAVIQVSATIKYDLLNTGRLRQLGQLFAHRLRGGDVKRFLTDGGR